MVWSLVVCFAIIGGFLLLLPRPNVNAVKVVSYSEAVVQATRVAPYTILAPEHLSEQWRATSVRLEVSDNPKVVHLHIGFVTPNNAYVGLEETNGPALDFVRVYTNGATPVAFVQVAGRSWQQQERVLGGKDQKSLVMYGTDSTVVLSGTAGWPELEELAASLQATR
jgi:hypothetical protein